MTGAPFAPWALRGEAVVALMRRRPADPLPPGLVAAPGPTLVSANRFTASPVGPFLQLSVAVPARLGGRLGWCVTRMIVDRQDARTGARLNWGFPAELGGLVWCDDGRERSLAWEEGGVEVRGRGRGPRVPLAVPHRELQYRGDGPVLVPDRFVGRFSAALVRVSTAEDSDLAMLGGRHPGAVVDGIDRVVYEARTPIGLIAPMRVAEPLMSDLPRAS